MVDFSQNKTVFLPLLATHANMPESMRTFMSVEDMGVGASVKRGAESVPQLLRLKDLTANKEKPKNYNAWLLYRSSHCKH